MKRIVPLVTALMLLVGGVAFGSAIDFDFNGIPTKSTWAWGGGTSTLSASADTVELNGYFLSSISFTSGPGTGGTGSSTDPYTFGPSASGSIVVTGTITGCNDCSTTVFLGQFQMEGASGNPDLVFTGDVTGTLGAGVASFFGLSSSDVYGNLRANLICSDNNCSPLGGITGSGNMAVAPVPEPSSLVLLGVSLGLCVILFYVTRRIRT